MAFDAKCIDKKTSIFQCPKTYIRSTRVTKLKNEVNLADPN